MTIANEAVLNGFYYVIVPVMIAAIAYIFAKLPATLHTAIYRSSVICLLGVVIAIQWFMWSDIRQLPQSVEEQRKAATRKEAENTVDVYKRLLGL